MGGKTANNTDFQQFGSVEDEIDAQARLIRVGSGLKCPRQHSGLWIRIRILETPVFARLLAENKIERSPVIEVLKRQPVPIVLSALIRLADQTPFYIVTAFVFSYGTGFLKMPRELLLYSVLSFAVIGLFLIPSAGHFSDRWKNGPTSSAAS